VWRRSHDIVRDGGEVLVTAGGKPTVEELGIDVTALDWQRSGEGDGAIEIAFVRDGATADWVLMRVSGDPGQRVLVFDRDEWECFLDGARNGEFDDAATAGSGSVDTARLTLPNLGFANRILGTLVTGGNSGVSRGDNFRNIGNRAGWMDP
jgi:hypothetical protein